MDDIHYIERVTGECSVERVYGRWALSLLYGDSFFARLFAALWLPLLARCSFLSRFYGFLQNRPNSKKKILRFIETFDIDSSEFADPVSSYRSFNEFFIRKLKPGCRPIDMRTDRVVMPADGRVLVFPDLSKTEGFYVKGQRFDLFAFLCNSVLARRYQEGSMMIVRLCPTDYHRFHFPFGGIPSRARAISGTLYSVNPVALGKRLSIFWENKRMVTELTTDSCGLILMVEIGATCVGTIHQTYRPEQSVCKGDEKGYFSFGGSSLALLFERGSIMFDEDLVENSLLHLETRVLFGSSLAQLRSR
jgi:phosphatidylserine decarboxylase